MSPERDTAEKRIRDINADNYYPKKALTMQLIQELSSIEFHDTILVSVRVDFWENVFELIMKDNPDAPSRQIQFKEISNLEIQGIEEGYTDLEISNADFSYENGRYLAKFMFLLGFGKPSWEVAFNFKDAVIK